MKFGGDPDADYDKAAILDDMITPKYVQARGEKRRTAWPSGQELGATIPGH